MAHNTTITADSVGVLCTALYLDTVARSVLPAFFLRLCCVFAASLLRLFAMGLFSCWCDQLAVRIWRTTEMVRNLPCPHGPPALASSPKAQPADGPAGGTATADPKRQSAVDEKRPLVAIISIQGKGRRTEYGGVLCPVSRTVSCDVQIKTYLCAYTLHPVARIWTWQSRSPFLATTRIAPELVPPNALLPRGAPPSRCQRPMPQQMHLLCAEFFLHVPSSCYCRPSMPLHRHAHTHAHWRREDEGQGRAPSAAEKSGPGREKKTDRLPLGVLERRTRPVLFSALAVLIRCSGGWGGHGNKRRAGLAVTGNH